MSQLTESVGALDRMRAQTAAHERMMVEEQTRGESRTRVDDAVGRAYDRMRNTGRDSLASPSVASSAAPSPSVVDSNQARLQSAVDNLRNRVNELSSARAALRSALPDHPGASVHIGADESMTSRGRRVMIRAMLETASDPGRQVGRDALASQRLPTRAPRDVHTMNPLPVTGFNPAASSTVDLRHLFQPSADETRMFTMFNGPPLQPASPSDEELPSLEVVPPTWGPDWGVTSRIQYSRPSPAVDPPEIEAFPIIRRRPVTRINPRILDGASQPLTTTNSETSDLSTPFEWSVWNSTTTDTVAVSWPPVEDVVPPSASRRRLDLAGRSVGVSRQVSNATSTGVNQGRRGLSPSSSEAATELADPITVYSPPFSPYVAPESVYSSIPAPAIRPRLRRGMLSPDHAELPLTFFLIVREDANGDETISDDEVASMRRREEARRRSRPTNQSPTYISSINRVGRHAESEDADKLMAGTANSAAQRNSAILRFEASRQISSSEPFKPHPLPIPEWINNSAPGVSHRSRARDSPPPPLHGSAGRARAALHAKGSRRLGRRVEHLVGR